MHLRDSRSILLTAVQGCACVWLVWRFCTMAYHDWCSHLWRGSEWIPKNHPVFPQHFITYLWIHWTAIL